jgi:hypothetical protein
MDHTVFKNGDTFTLEELVRSYIIQLKYSGNMAVFVYKKKYLGGT